MPVMRRWVAFTLGTVINVIFGGIMGYFNGGPPPTWSDLPGVLMYVAGDWASVPLLLGIMFAVYFTLLLFSRKKSDDHHVDEPGSARLRSGELRERNMLCRYWKKQRRKRGSSAYSSTADTRCSPS